MFIVPIVVGAVFCLALLAGLQWSAEPMFRPPQGLYSGNDADLIRQCYPHRLVDPSELNVAHVKSITSVWALAEIKARIKVVTVSLGILAGGAVMVAYFWGKRTSANKPPQGSSQKLAP